MRDAKVIIIFGIILVVVLAWLIVQGTKPVFLVDEAETNKELTEKSLPDNYFHPIHLYKSNQLRKRSFSENNANNMAYFRAI